MKLSLDRKLILLFACAGLTVIVGSILAWYGLGRLFEESDHAKQLADRMNSPEVADILGRPGGIAEAKKEIHQLEQLNNSLEKEEASLIGVWWQATDEACGTGKDWSKDANKWKDLLVRYNDEILKKSGKGGDLKKVVLGPNFYLGLEDYKQKSPAEAQVPSLATQLSVSKRLVDLLFEAKSKAVEGYPTACILLKFEGPAISEGELTAEKKSPSKPQGNEEIKRDGYSLQIECSPEVLFTFLSALTKDAWLFIPTNLTLENEKGIFPKRSELAGLFAPPPQADAPSLESARGGGSTNPPLLLVLAGKEKVRVNLQVDFVQWKSSLASEKKKGQDPKQ